MPNKKGKMPPQLLEYFKNKNKKKEDGKDMSDKDYWERLKLFKLYSIQR